MTEKQLDALLKKGHVSVKELPALDSPFPLVGEGYVRCPSCQSFFTKGLSACPRCNKKTHKYGAVKTEVDGIRFDSGLEAKYYLELKVREKAGEVRDIKTHVPYPFVIDEVKVFTYEADFVYEERVGGVWVEKIVDTKGVLTPEFRLKAKCLSAKGVHIEVYTKDGFLKRF